MRRLSLLAAMALAATASACGPNPIIARDPLPAPGPADAYACRSGALPLNAFDTNCVRIPVTQEPVVRAKG